MNMIIKSLVSGKVDIFNLKYIFILIVLFLGVMVVLLNEILFGNVLMVLMKEFDVIVLMI